MSGKNWQLAIPDGDNPSIKDFTFSLCIFQIEMVV